MVFLTKIYKKLLLYFFTIKDIGYKRIIRRLIYISKNTINKKFFKFILSNYSNLYKYNNWININFDQQNKKAKLFTFPKPYKFEFDINNEIKIFDANSIWTGPYPNRLWEFNLQYFNWAILSITECSNDSDLEKKLFNISCLIDSWISYQSVNHSDGWHSYTLSIRIRNWIWLFRFFPYLITIKRLNSLWEQIYWLYKNQEYYLEGNHYLENLISLIIGSLQFEGKESKEVLQISLFNLENELKKQILNDGGHFERSASYHLSLLESLTILGYWIQIFKNKRPIWLVKSIKKMFKWSLKVHLKNGKYPRFNDSIFDKQINIKNINNFAYIYLYQNKLFKEKKLTKDDQYKFLRNFKKVKVNMVNNLKFDVTTKYKIITNLKDTGWTILRPSRNWEICFKSGLSCPAFLPGHAHSDVCSFDIFYKGKPIIVETGISQYEKSKIRNYERSGLAHNIMQFTDKKSINLDTFDDWSEPLEVWDSFRAARKYKIISSSSGIIKKDILWAKCSYRPFNKYLISHSRTIYCHLLNQNFLRFKIKDEVYTKTNLFWRLNFHLAPNQSSMIFSNLINKKNNSALICSRWINSWTSYNFGDKHKSKSLLLFGSFTKGYNFKSSSFLIDFNK